MYLSQLLVNPGAHPDAPRPGIDWVKQTYRVHQRLWMAFPGKERQTQDPFFLGAWDAKEKGHTQRDASGFLYRIEPDPPLRILVQSIQPPHWDYAFQNAMRLLCDEPSVRQFDPTYTEQAKYRFRLVMLMVKRATENGPDGRKSRRELPIKCVKDLPDGRVVLDQNHTAWRERLQAQADRNGFSVDPDKLVVSPVTNLYMKPTGKQRAQQFNAAMFDGIIECTDAAKLSKAVVRGIGRGRAFGMGLLSLAKIR